MWIALLIGCGEDPTGINEVGSGWIELYNGEDAGVRFDEWVVETPAGAHTVRADASTEPGGLLLVETDVVPEAGGPVDLFDADGARVQRIELPALQPESSYGRFPDGAANWQLLDLPTPGASNQLGG